MPVNLDDFQAVAHCVYKDEHYSVRDNGAVLRHARAGKLLRKNDNQWTLGTLNAETGYLQIGTARIHRIVATAFHGEPPTKEHIADHVDTNKQNNRPENLRWVTRLENILLNPITAKRIAFVCGSVEAFLADPAKFREKFQQANMTWMRPVSAEEARTSKERLLVWANSDKSSAGGSLDEWIFRDDYNSSYLQEPPEFVISETPNAAQRDWKTPCEFLCCPQETTDTPIYTYAQNLKTGEIFSRNKYTYSIISDFATSGDGNTLWIVCKAGEENAMKPWLLAQVTYEDNLFVHTNLGSFFEKAGAEKEFTLAQGLEWTGGDSIDDYC